MKSMIFTLMIAFFSTVCFAQPSDESQIKNVSTTTSIDSLDRMIKLENEVKELKATTAQLQQQIADLKKQFPVKKKKLVVSRTSSKQGVWADE